MARREDRRRAIELRLRGKTYSEIKSRLGLSKSTLSVWLNRYPLTNRQLERIKAKRPKQIEKYRQTMAKKRTLRENLAYATASKQWLPLSDRELLLAGIFLYWGEGTKVSPGYLCISNSDPRVIKFAYAWMTKSLMINPQQIHVLLHLYSDMSIETETQYWSNLIDVPLVNFRKPYVKKSTRTGLTYKSFGHGTCNIYTLNSPLKRQIIQSINALSDHYGKIV